MVKLSGKSIQHTVSHGLTIQTKYEALESTGLACTETEIIASCRSGHDAYLADYYNLRNY